MIWGCIGQFRYNTETEIPNPKYSIDDPIPPSAGGNIPQNTGKDNPEFLRKIPSPEVKRPRIPCRLAYTSREDAAASSGRTRVSFEKGRFLSLTAGII